MSRVAVLVDVSPGTGMRQQVGIGSYAQTRGWQLSFFAPAVGSLRAVDRGYVGVIVASPNAEVEAALAAFGKPAVAMVSGRRLPLVTHDERELGRLAGEHLVSRGYRRVLFWGPGDGWSVGRWEGVREAVEAGGGSMLGPGPAGHWDERANRWAVAAALAGVATPLGVVAASDGLALEVIGAALGAGLRVPEDVAVIGVDNNLARCLYGPVPLSSVDTNLTRVGYEAARLLGRMVDGEAGREAGADAAGGVGQRGPADGGEPVGAGSEGGRPVVVVPAKTVVLRRSTDASGVEDREVAAALEVIRGSMGRPVGVEALAAAVGVSRSSLERRFRAALGVTPGEQAERMRLGEAARLLEQTEIKLSEVGARCGYRHATHFSKRFRERYGATPGEWRTRRRGSGEIRGLEEAEGE